MEEDNKRRYALEWFVRKKDEWYWNRTQGLIAEKAKKAETLVKISAAASGVAVVISVLSLLRKS